MSANATSDTGLDALTGLGLPDEGVPDQPFWIWRATSIFRRYLTKCLPTSDSWATAQSITYVGTMPVRSQRLAETNFSLAHS